MTTAAEMRALQELVNVASSFVPCDSGSGNCRVHAAVHKALPALNSVLGRLRIEAATHPEKGLGFGNPAV